MMNNLFPFIFSSIVIIVTANELQLLPFKIVGGNTASIEEFPYQASLEEQNYHFCGGTIISEKYVLTAGHCFPTVERMKVPKWVNVRVGVDVLYTNTGQKVGIAKVVVHPQYEYIYNDIAVVELKTPLQFNDKIQPIKLPKDNETLPAGTIVDVSGYGFTQTDDYNNTLQAVAVPIIDNDECNSYYSGHVKDYMICAGLKEGGKDACQGDSGGPMAYRGKLFGIVSWGKKCAQAYSPGVYTSVVYFLPFIREVTGIGN